MKHKVATLEGAELDAAVAMAEGLHFSIEKRHPQPMAAVIGPPPTLCWVTGWKIAGGMPFCPSSDWAIGGPLIERMQISVVAGDDPDAAVQAEWSAQVGRFSDYIDESLPIGIVGTASSTFLIAAMRAFVAWKFGAEVELPEAPKE